jgi:hypothetical protein
MALSELYESTIIEVKAYFGFDHYACQPEDISLALGLQPDDVRRAGDRRAIGKKGKQIAVPFNSWSIESHCQSKDVNDHLRELLRKLKNTRSQMKPEFGEPTFSVLWKGSYLYAGSGPFYEADVVQGIAELGASLWQDIYQVNQE